MCSRQLACFTCGGAFACHGRRSSWRILQPSPACSQTSASYYTVLAVEQLDMIGRRSNKTALLAIACREQRTYPPASPTISLTWLRLYQQQLDRRSCTYAKPCSI